MLGDLSIYPLKTVIFKKYFIDILNYIPQYFIEDININTYYAPPAPLFLWFVSLVDFEASAFSQMFFKLGKLWEIFQIG